MKTLAILLMTLAPLAAQDAQPTPERKMGLARPVVFEKSREVYGAHLKGAPLVTLNAMLADAKAWHGKNVQVRGEITSVCAKKGCWMVVKDGDQSARIRFRDYGFFVPLDAAGQKTALEGTVVVRVETEAERRHYAEDAGLPREKIEAITGDTVELSLLADAVQMGELPPVPTAKVGDATQGPTKGVGISEPVCPEVQTPDKKGTKEPEKKTGGKKLEAPLKEKGAGHRN